MPSVERTLHALAVAIVRQRSNMETLSKDPSTDIPSWLEKRVEEVIKQRVETVSADDREYVIEKLRARMAEWNHWMPGSYGTFFGMAEDPALMHSAGQTPPDSWKNYSWPTLTSMRGVDAAAEADVTQYFNDPEVSAGDNGDE